MHLIFYNNVNLVPALGCESGNQPSFVFNSRNSLDQSLAEGR